MPKVEAFHLTEYEIQVLLGCSIHGCNMSPDRVFSLHVAWHRLHAIGLIDRTDGLAIVTDDGKEVVSRIIAALSSAAVAEREPVAWRWKPKDSEAWIYDPKHEWLEAQSRDEIDAEPLYLDPPHTSELEALRKRVDELEKALEPFAEYRHNIGYLQPDGFTITNAPIMAPFRNLTLGDLRAARRVREGGKANG